MKRRNVGAVVGAVLLLNACGAPAATWPPTSAAALAATATIQPATLPPTLAAPTATPLATGRAAPSSTPAATVDALHAACDHYYRPLRTGAVWHFSTKVRIYTEAVTPVTGNLAQTEATLVEENMDGSNQKILIECFKDGLAYGDSLVSYSIP